MNRETQAGLAWQLMDIAKPFLPKEARIWVYASIGGGEQELAIRELLCRLVNDGLVVPADLHATLSAWAAGYQGSDEEDELNSLVSRVPIGESSAKPERDPAAHDSPAAQRTTRHDDHLERPYINDPELNTDGESALEAARHRESYSGSESDAAIGYSKRRTPRRRFNARLVAPATCTEPPDCSQSLNSAQTLSQLMGESFRLK